MSITTRLALALIATSLCASCQPGSQTAVEHAWSKQSYVIFHPNIAPEGAIVELARLAEERGCERYGDGFYLEDPTFSVETHIEGVQLLCPAGKSKGFPVLLTVGFGSPTVIIGTCPEVRASPCVKTVEVLVEDLSARRQQGSWRGA